MNKSRLTGTVFIDLKMASDTIDHDFLLQRQDEYGVTDLKHTWHFSYLKNRWQYCRVNWVTSSVEEIYCGVPHGSCLVPRLILLCITDLPFSLKTEK